jgi:hypothetical protein
MGVDGRDRAALVAKFGSAIFAEAERTLVPNAPGFVLERRCEQIAYAIERDRKQTLQRVPQRAHVPCAELTGTRVRRPAATRARVRGGRIMRVRAGARRASSSRAGPDDDSGGPSSSRSPRLTAGRFRLPEERRP